MNICPQDFSAKQTDITNQKLKVYIAYMQEFCYKLIMQYGVVFIADLFCWAWYNWDKKWSPLLLIDLLSTVLDTPEIIKKWPNARVYLLLNDSDKESIIAIKEILNTYVFSNKIKIISMLNSFDDVKHNISSIIASIDISVTNKQLTCEKLPKFFFLDPFTFSIISTEDLNVLLNLGNTEILLFSPVFDAFRFKQAKNVISWNCHKTKKFIEDYTGCEMKDYNDIYEFNDSIVSNLKSVLKVRFVLYILLEAGTRKNVLFHITSHPVGALAFNKIARKLWDYGMGIDVKYRKVFEQQWTLFPDMEKKQSHSKIEIFGGLLLKMLESKTMSNTDIVYTALEKWFLPKEVNVFLMKNKAQLKVRYVNWGVKWFYISASAWKEKKCFISIKK